MTESLWHGDALDLDGYLGRIGYDGPLEPTLETLRGLQQRHVAAIPFENLEIMLGRPVPLDIESLQAKLVRQRRGGYCFEQNLLLAAVLERLGFSFTGLAARVRMGSLQRRATTHMLLRVVIDGAPWMADAGFGGEGLLEPLPIRTGTEARQGGWTFGLAAGGEGEHVMRSLHPDGWFDLHTFTLEPHYRVDYEVLNYYISTNPRSPFTARAVIQRTAPDVRRSLVGQELTVQRPGAAEERLQITADELPDVLAEFFGIELSTEDTVILRKRYERDQRPTA